MFARFCFVPAALLLSTPLLAQGSYTSDSCAATEQALLAVAHDFWAAYNHRDVAAMDKLLDDRLLFVGESGNVLSKAQFLAPFRVPEGSMRSESAEQPGDVRTLFADETALISFTRAWTITHQASGATFGATSRMTETFVCRGGAWKVIAFQETMIPNPARQVYRPTADYLDDYGGKYRFGEDGRGGDIVVTRQGDQIYESWGTDKPVEIFPGKYDTFFTPGFPILERFVRDRSGRVVGIVYTMGDNEVEAKRMP